MKLQILTVCGDTRKIPSAATTNLRSALHGAVVTPDDPDYDAARSIWNAMVDRRPGLIIQAADAADVAHAVNFARDHRAVLAVRGGGHNIAGSAVCEGGVTLDLSRMRSVQVDPTARRARVAGGALLADVDQATQAFGLAVPVGINSTTGVAGLTLGGGYGWTSRKLGLAIDNLASVDIVTADGRLRRADAEEHPDLFWALRGGSGNFGVVTQFDFRLHELKPQVVAGMLIYPMEQAPALLQQFRDLLASAPDELTCWPILRKAPPVAFIPQAWHGKEVFIISLCHCGSIADGQGTVAPFRALGRPIVDTIGPRDFVAWQCAADGLLEPGFRNYWKSHDLMDLTDADWRVMVDFARRLPSADSYVVIAHVGGEVSRIADDTAAFSRRTVRFIVSVHARWHDQAEDADCIAWARGLFDALSPRATGTVYVNYMSGDEAERVRGAYGTSYDRLAEIKDRYDPENLFRHNQNIGAALPGTASHRA